MTEAASPPTPGSHRWVSLMVHDLAAARSFYQGLFGWEYHRGAPRLGPYLIATRDGRQVAGLGEITQDGLRVVGWLPYVATADADATADRIRECGGTLAVGPIELAGVGRLAVVADVCGAAFGLWQGGRARRSPLAESAGVPVWNELVTGDVSLVSAFYTKVFGYRATPGPGLPGDRDYVLLYADGRRVAALRGVGDALPRDRGPHWLPYFATADVAASARRAVELGGQVLREPEESPIGRLAWLCDPEGAPFGLVHRD